MRLRFSPPIVNPRLVFPLVSSAPQAPGGARARVFALTGGGNGVADRVLLHGEERLCPYLFFLEKPLWLHCSLFHDSLSSLLINLEYLKLEKVPV